MLADPVHIAHLRLTDFRNYPSLSLETDGRHIVLTGANGAGKTNILEALSLLSPGRGLRRAAYADIGRAGAGSHGPVPWSVYCQLQSQGETTAIGTGLMTRNLAVDTLRRVRIDGTQSPSEYLLDHCRIVWLTPAMDGLFTGPAGDRRRFLDRLVLAIDPAHGKRVTAFEKAIRARNRLLEQPRPDAAWLDGIEAQMAEAAIAIHAARAELVSLLTALIAQQDETGPFPAAALALDGDFGLTGLHHDSDGEDMYRSQLCRDRMRDAAAGRTLNGPHRSDLSVNHAPKQMPAAACSTGEQKALLTGIVLAHGRLVAQVSGMAPILLLDEIAAHLDPARREGLFDLIDAMPCQAWMTGTDAALFTAMGARAQHFGVNDAIVTLSEAA